jgi:hypothetical protein
VDCIANFWDVFKVYYFSPGGSINIHIYVNTRLIDLIMTGLRRLIITVISVLGPPVKAGIRNVRCPVYSMMTTYDIPNNVQSIEVVLNFKFCICGLHSKFLGCLQGLLFFSRGFHTTSASVISLIFFVKNH